MVSWRLEPGKGLFLFFEHREAPHTRKIVPEQ